MKTKTYIIATPIRSLHRLQKDDVFEDPGINNIYMPQASLNNGGNEYNVPFGGNSENYTFDETTKKLKIVLGVKNSGLSTDGFAVKVKVDAQATNAYVEKYKNDEKKPAVVTTRRLLQHCLKA